MVLVMKGVGVALGVIDIVGLGGTCGTSFVDLYSVDKLRKFDLVWNLLIRQP